VGFETSSAGREACGYPRRGAEGSGL
jgi:hypothetical protein